MARPSRIDLVDALRLWFLLALRPLCLLLFRWDISSGYLKIALVDVRLAPTEGHAIDIPCPSPSSFLSFFSLLASFSASRLWSTARCTNFLRVSMVKVIY